MTNSHSYAGNAVKSVSSLSEEDGAHRDAGVVNTSYHSNDASLDNLNMPSLKNPANAPVQPLASPQSINQVRRYKVLRICSACRLVVLHLLSASSVHLPCFYLINDPE